MKPGQTRDTCLLVFSTYLQTSCPRQRTSRPLPVSSVAKGLHPCQSIGILSHVYHSAIFSLDDTSRQAYDIPCSWNLKD